MASTLERRSAHCGIIRGGSLKAYANESAHVKTEVACDKRAVPGRCSTSIPRDILLWLDDSFCFDHT
eukprot:scaffold2009_cov156-Skeletonema_marinoi.AAC.4